MRAKWLLTNALASSVFMLFIATNAWAIPPGPCDEKPKDVCCEEPKPGPFAFSYPMDMNLSCPRDFYFRADLLVMQPREDGLEYAIENTSGAGGVPVTGGDVAGFGSDNNNWSWDLGFRLGLGFYLNHDQWQLDLNWFWFKINQEDQASAQGGSALIPLWFQANPTAQNTLASARWHLSMNVLDISLGKPYHVSRYLVFFPFFGIRAAWIDQNYTARYGGQFSNPSVDGPKFRSKNDFWGVGGRMGVNTTWTLGAGWDLLANLSTAFLVGEIDTSQNTQAGSNHSIQSEFEFDQINPNLEMQLGLSWGTYFNRQQHHFALQVMYEFQQWWDQLWLRKFHSTTLVSLNDTVSRGDLKLSGVSIRFLFNF